MAVFGRLTVVAVIVCCLCLIEAKKSKENDRVSKGNQGHQGPKNHHQRHFVKRDAYDYQGYDDERPEYSNFDRPHRIRVLPGFLH
ncbi:hypothetical protein SFRURICE_000468 [Spodoptera frugiperda]|uniref:SFRICE_009531 n=1 Tax=Spodoptera frugiperda TaxID=7108 RepID=A0A2H1WRZ4_SPOFR|nr:hypothetical protein SFRURICE_000468 [Spodoptera frugiperda]